MIRRPARGHSRIGGGRAERAQSRRRRRASPPRMSAFTNAAPTGPPPRTSSVIRHAPHAPQALGGAAVAGTIPPTTLAIRITRVSAEPPLAPFRRQSHAPGTRRVGWRKRPGSIREGPCARHTAWRLAAAPGVRSIREGPCVPAHGVSAGGSARGVLDPRGSLRRAHRVAAGRPPAPPHNLLAPASAAAGYSIHSPGSPCISPG